MTQQTPPPLPARQSLDPTNGFRAALGEFTTSIRELGVVQAALTGRFDALAYQLRKQLIGQLLAAVVFVLVSSLLLGHACSQASRLSDVTSQLDESTRMLESLRTESSATQKKVDDVKEVVDTQPKVEVVAVDGGAGRPPKAAVVLRPKTPPKPAGSAAPGPAIEVPLDLPKAKITDGGAP